MAFTAAASAVAAGSLAVAAMPQDDRRLIELEEKIFEEWRAAKAFEPEIVRLSEIWHAEFKRLADQARDEHSGLGNDEAFRLAGQIPECQEHSRLCELEDTHVGEMEALIKEMWATPAHTSEGRRAKVQVLLVCIMGDGWTSVDEQTEWHELNARNLLIELIGGEPGDRLRDQFA